MKFLSIAAVAAIAAMSAVPAFASTTTIGAMGMMSGTMGEHGMPAGKMGADGVPYTGKPDLDAAVSLVTAGGPIGKFSITTAIASLAGPAVAKAEVRSSPNSTARQRSASSWRSRISPLTTR